MLVIFKKVIFFNNLLKGKHEGYYGKSKYRYVGENSEGNRFIANNDL